MKEIDPIYKEMAFTLNRFEIGVDSIDENKEAIMKGSHPAPFLPCKVLDSLLLERDDDDESVDSFSTSFWISDEAIHEKYSYHSSHHL